MKSILIFAILYGLLPLGFYWKIKPVNLAGIKPFLMVVFVASLYEFIGAFLLKVDFKNWYLIYKTMAFASLLFFFNSIVEIKKSMIWVAILGFSTLLLLTFTTWEKIQVLQINAYFNISLTILVLLFTSLWLIATFKKLETDSLWNDPNYFFVVGLNVYYFGTALLFIMSNYIFNKDPKSLEEYWLLNIILNLVLRTTLILGIWKSRMK